jgi:hypothetical protein
MTARDFLRRQLSDDVRAKLNNLPTVDALNSLLGQRQPLDDSLTTLSGTTIGTKGLDLLAASMAEEVKAELSIKTADVEGLEDGLSKKADDFDILNGGTF